jgi:hypothetical protein
MRTSEPSSLTGSGERRIKCALPPHLMQRTGRINFCSLTTKERFSTGPPPTPTVPPNAADKRCGIRTTPLCATKKLCKTSNWNPIETVPPRAGTSEAECGQRVPHWDCTRLQSYDIPAQASCRFWNFNPQQRFRSKGGERCSAHEHIDDSPHGAWRKPAERLIRGSRRSSLKWPRNGNGSPRKPRAKKTITSFGVRNQIPVIE